MRNIAPRLVWGFNRIIKIFGNLFSFIVRVFVPVRKGRVMCWSHNFKQFSCNPRYLAEYLVENNPEFEVFWVLRKGVSTEGMDNRIKTVRFRSFEYYKLVNSAEFLITNSRTDPYRMCWHKRSNQKYIMLWHGGVALKKIEEDAKEKLTYAYLKRAKIDSGICDLMVSGCGFQTTLLKEKFWYDGEILEKGIPRNDIFFKPEQHVEIKKRVIKEYSIPEGNKIVLYAPTFRRSRSLKPYKIDWDSVMPHLSRMLEGPVTVMLRLHPHLINCSGVSDLVKAPGVINVTRYPDIQELLCISDMLITDYSSSMFDMALFKRPCFIYATDIDEYDRGFYFKLKDLPFPLAESQKELIGLADTYDNAAYMESLDRFLNETIRPIDDGNASKAISEWMKQHSF